MASTCGRANGEYIELGPWICADVNLRFVNVDAAWLSGLKAYQSLFLLVAIYDIACQYMINFFARMAGARSSLAELATLSPEDATNFPQIIFGVPKWHEMAHQALCRYIFGLRYLPGMGQTDGEAQERTWSLLNALSFRTREMASGHRHDTICDFVDYSNMRRERTIRTCWNHAFIPRALVTHP